MRRALPSRPPCRSKRAPLGVALAVLASAALAAPRQARAQETTREIARLIADRRDASTVEEELRRLYRSDGGPLWTLRGVPTPFARAAITMLESADVHGLDPRDYGADTLRARASNLAVGSGEGARAAAFDVSLSASLLRFVAHVHRGRVDPRTLGIALAPDSTTDLPGAVRALSGGANGDSLIAALSPPYLGYEALRRVMARYRVLASDTGLHLPAITLRRSARAGDSLGFAPALRRLLVAVGDLPRDDESQASGDQYDSTLAGAVARFQRRHGLEPDSVLGPLTLSALRVPLATRVQQMALTLERWRWLPHQPPGRYVMLDIPAFELWAFTSDSAASCPALVMRAIVGQSAGHRTPMFTSAMREVIFRPYWDVPLRIARTELLPLIRRNPDYLRREHMQIVRGGETDAIVYPPTAANLDAVAAGRLRLRQLPGPWNALGLIKFVFPNPYDVYLHGTPQQELFEHARRDFSHGCMRLETPAGLAALVLDGQEGWNREAIEAAMQGDRTRHVAIARPVTVFVIYATAVAAADEVAFYPDVYGHDATLRRALAARLR